MSEQFFPPEVPEIGALVRVTPVKVDYVPKNYKFFCEEADVVSRFVAVNCADRETCVEVFLCGFYIRKLIYNPKYDTWHTNFDGMSVQVEVEKLLQ